MNDDIYRQDIMDIYKNPSHKGTIDNADAQAHEINPFCGDELTLTLKINEGKITDAKFTGETCAVASVSAEMLIEEILNKSLDEAKNIDKEKLLEILNINLTTSRVKCATLPLETLHKALDLYKTDNK